MPCRIHTFSIGLALKPSIIGCLIVSSPIIWASQPEYIETNSQNPGATEEVESSTKSLGFNSRDLDPEKFLSDLRTFLPETGISFLDEATYKLQPRTYYRLTDYGLGIKSEALATGGSLQFQSGYYSDIVRFSMTSYTSQKLYGPGDRDGSGLLQPEQEGYSVIGDAFLDIKLEDTQLALGLQRLNLPYLNANDVRMTPNSFEAYSVIFNKLENTELGFGYVNRIRPRTSTDYISMSEQAGADGSDEGLYALGFHHNFSEHFNLGGINLYTPDTYNNVYLETNHTTPISEDLSLNTGLQFTSQDSVGDESIGDFSTQHYGVRCSAKMGNLSAGVSHTYTSSGGDIRKPWGGSPSFNSIMLADFDRAEERAYGARIAYDFTGPYLDAFAADVKWVYGDTPEGGSNASSDYREYDINLNYFPPKLERLRVRLRYAHLNTVDDENRPDVKDLRLILNYAVSF